MATTTDEITLLSHLHPEIYTTIPPQPGEGKRRRRSKKAKAESEELGKKRKLTQQQLYVLEMSFRGEHKLETEKKDRLAMELSLEPRQVAVWFQNRRARYKAQKLEDEFSQLKAQHDAVVAEKSLLQTEVLKLKEELSSAEKVLHSLNSPSSSSSFSVEADQFLQNYPMGVLDNVMEEYHYSWVNLF